MRFLFGIIFLVLLLSTGSAPAQPTVGAEPTEVIVQVTVNGVQVAETSSVIPAGGAVADLASPASGHDAPSPPRAMEQPSSTATATMGSENPPSPSSALVTLYDYEEYRGESTTFTVTNECKNFEGYWQDQDA